MGISEIVLVGGLAPLGIALALIAFFGIKNIITGKHEWQKIVVIIIPAVIFGIAYGVTGQTSESALITLSSLIGLMVLLIFFGGLRSSFKF